MGESVKKVNPFKVLPNEEEYNPVYRGRVVLNVIR
jgi:hypothetical protein